MATIGVDCQVVLDGVGYWVEPHSYRVHRPRLRQASVTSGGGERYVDAGPGKRVWSFTVLALNDLTRYDGQPTGVSGQQYRDALVASYGKSGALAFVDLEGIAWSVRFDDLVEAIPDPRTQLTGPSYLLDVELWKPSRAVGIGPAGAIGQAHTSSAETADRLTPNA